MPVRDQLTGTGQYLVRFWGSGQDAAASVCPIPVGLEDGGGAFYARFDNPAERTAFFEAARKAAAGVPGLFGRGGVVVLDTSDGPDTLLRTIAIPTFEWRGVRYVVEHDFGYGYPADAAEYMWTHGNYGCDCNRGMYLASQHPEAADADTGECGNEIVMVAFRVEKR